MSFQNDSTGLPPSAPLTDTSLERTLREQQTLLDNAGAGIAFIRQRHVVRCNRRYAEIFGYESPEALIGQQSESFHPDPTAFRELGRAAYPVVSAGQTFRVERIMRRRDGTMFWGRLSGSLINPKDTSEGSIWIIDDIDEQKNAQVQLDAAICEKQILLDNAMVGIVYLRDRQLTRCNRHFEQMLGYEPGELLGSPSRRWLPSDEAWEDVGRRCYEPLARGLAFEGELSLCRKDGTPVVCVVRSKAIDPSDLALGSIWICMDITARKQAQSELIRVHAELESLVAERTQQLRETVDTLHREIDDRKLDQERIYWLAHYDPLTGLPNRTLLAERSTQAIEVARQEQTPISVIFLDLDHFKHVNDSLGHRVGDALLVQIAKRLRAVVREKDTVCRLGGDEFILLLPGANARGAARVAGKLLEASRQPYQIEHHELTMAPSMGIAVYPDDGTDFDSLSQSADVAMYRAKLDGRNTYRFFTPEMQARSVRSLQLENALRRALERQQFSLHYQPQVCIATQQVLGVEALLRWQHPELGMVSPAEFIPIAEDCGQILPIGEWVLRTALAQLKHWHMQGLTLPSMSVNLSAIQFRQPSLPELIARILAETGLSPGSLELELTEGVAMDDPRMAIATMDQLHNLGVQLSIDDFGTGYSSLSQLKRFPISKLKIDQSFVRDLGEDANDRAIVSAIIRMAQALGMETIAEGVETRSQFEFLRDQGCTQAQGFYCGQPQPADQLQIYLQACRKAVQSGATASPRQSSPPDIFTAFLR
ncbi:sensor domain-containing protein [Simplicispira lacusdiani]|uniref:sensor domain-containing protein n=1 Tax=Simplicispira lacusdiani TaxID=2213010 RepID=UPI000E7331DD|nr:bifunctional diguanylate cyclase/phosphodiesterase [Simplicispira lacusdiani]